MTGGRRLITIGMVAIMGVTMLSGCMSAQIPEPSSGAKPPATSQPANTNTDKPTAPATKPTQSSSGAYDGWETFEPCGHEYGVKWEWVDGFPAGEMEDNGLYPDCAELWLTSRGSSESLLTAMVDFVPAEKIWALGESLEASGYVLTHSSFDPAVPPDEAYYGTNVYYLDGNDGADATGVAIEVYGEDEHNDSFQVYIDYFSPETRMHQ